MRGKAGDGLKCSQSPQVQGKCHQYPSVSFTVLVLFGPSGGILHFSLKPEMLRLLTSSFMCSVQM